jgi:uncharacterized protein (DUF2461 family)
MQRFNSFPTQTLDFLEAPARNNNRDGFNTNKQHYGDYVREPALTFIEQMSPRLQKISGHFSYLTPIHELFRDSLSFRLSQPLPNRIPRLL